MTSKQLEKLIIKEGYSYSVVDDGDFRVDCHGNPVYVVLDKDERNLVTIFVQVDVDIAKETSLFTILELLTMAQAAHRCVQCILYKASEKEDAKNIVFRIRIEVDNEPEFLANTLNRYFLIIFEAIEFVFNEIKQYRV